MIHNPFYDTGAWKKKREQILRNDHHECQICKKRGAFVRAEIVHHVRHVEDAPELALSDTYIDDNGMEQRQLISVCRVCHETRCHPDRMHNGASTRDENLAPERWD